MQTEPSEEMKSRGGPHSRFGPLLFEQKYPIVPGVASLVLGAIVFLAGMGSFAMSRGNPKAFVAGICGLGFGATISAYGIYYLLLKTGMSYYFYRNGLVYRNRSSAIEVPYSEIASFSVHQTRSGGQMPGTYFNMQFFTREGKDIKYRLGVDQGDAARMAHAEKLIKYIQASIPAGAFR